MIVDLHVHPFCKEATVTPSLGEAVQWMFFGFKETRDALDRVDIAPSFRSKILGENAMPLPGLPSPDEIEGQRSGS